MFSPLVRNIYIASRKCKPGKILRRCCSSKVRNAFSKSSQRFENAPHNQSACQIPSYGQPTFITHPFLLSEGEILPGLKVNEFQNRRKKFMELIFVDTFSTYGRPAHHVVIVPSATKLYMTEKIPYIFHQSTDFLYLSGCLEPDIALVLSGSCVEDMTSFLFLRPPDLHAEIWDGPRTGADIAPELFGVDQAFSISQLSSFLVREAEEHPNHLFYYDMITNNTQVHCVIVDHLKKYDLMLCRSCKNFIDKLRLIKSHAEQNLMRKAGEISSLAIVEAMKISQPGITEHQLFATVDFESRMHGAEILAYPPVVASGKNANIIHYIANNQVTEDGDLILMDAGCEYHGYCGDISRTWPINGKFSKYQRILYEIVLEVQKKLIATCEERLSLDALYHKMIFLFVQYLQSERILKNNVYDSNKLFEIARDLCPHHVGHYLGMDVHDVKTTTKDLALIPGMVITVEPGMYTKENNNIAPEFWNLGIRVEDDVLITDTSYEILSARCPKDVQDIEEIMKK